MFLSVNAGQKLQLHMRKKTSLCYSLNYSFHLSLQTIISNACHRATRRSTLSSATVCHCLFCLSSRSLVFVLPAVSAERRCHNALRGMSFRMFHLISLTSPVSRGAVEPGELRHPVEQSWLTCSLPEGPALALSLAWRVSL